MALHPTTASPRITGKARTSQHHEHPFRRDMVRILLFSCVLTVEHAASLPYGPSMREHVIAQSNVATKIQIAIPFQKVAALGASGPRPIVGLATDRQMSCLVQPQHTAIAVEDAGLSIRMDRFDACTRPTTEFVIRDPNQCLVKAAFHIPIMCRAVEQIAQSSLGDAVSIFLEGAWVVRVQRLEAKDAQNTNGMHAHHAVVAAGYVTNFQSLIGIGAFAAQVYAERFIADLHGTQALRQQYALDTFLFEQPAFVVTDVPEVLTRLIEKRDRPIQVRQALGVRGLSKRWLNQGQEAKDAEGQPWSRLFVSIHVRTSPSQSFSR